MNTGGTNEVSSLARSMRCQDNVRETRIMVIFEEQGWKNNDWEAI